MRRKQAASACYPSRGSARPPVDLGYFETEHHAQLAHGLKARTQELTDKMRAAGLPL